MVVRECPLCPKPHNDERSNLWTLNIKTENGVFLCFRCGKHGTWNEFVSHLMGDELKGFSEEFIDSAPSAEEMQTLAKFYSEKQGNLKNIIESKS